MDDTLNQIEPLIERIEGYGKTSFELYKLEVIGIAAQVVSTFVSRGAAAVAILLFLTFASFGFALWLGDLLGKPHLGFFSLAAVYFVLGGVLFFFLHRYVKRKVSDVMIAEILRK